ERPPRSRRRAGPAAGDLRRRVPDRTRAGAPPASAPPATRRPARRRGLAAPGSGAAGFRRDAVPAAGNQRGAGAPHHRAGHRRPVPADPQSDVRRLRPRPRRSGAATALDVGAVDAGAGAGGSRPDRHPARGALSRADLRRGVPLLRPAGQALAV
ncbi:MAG: hypothetical protein AVDCRST_MAG65-921, partial [uncultured Solirubrobacteraceae bacterium]